MVWAEKNAPDLAFHRDRALINDAVEDGMVRLQHIILNGLFVMVSTQFAVVHMLSLSPDTHTHTHTHTTTLFHP
jgi:hypothetical protein